MLPRALEHSRQAIRIYQSVEGNRANALEFRERPLDDGGNQGPNKRKNGGVRRLRALVHPSSGIFRSTIARAAKLIHSVRLLHSLPAAGLGPHRSGSPGRPGNTCSTLGCSDVAPFATPLRQVGVRTPMRKLLQTASAVISAVLIALAVSSVEVTPQSVSCLVTTANGDVQGTATGSSCTFLGIPFARNTDRDLTLEAAATGCTLGGHADCGRRARHCPQINPAGSTTTVGTEDCLKLNIWTPNPAPATPAPVIVWMHTGAFQAANANLADSRGQNLAERTGAIVVAPGYRHGPFGFLGHSALTAEDPAYPSSGNYGFLDQRAALVWVRRQHRRIRRRPAQRDDRRTIGGWT